MLANLLLAYTNVYGVRVVCELEQQNRWLASWVLFGSILASFGYHLVENQKHQMVGIGYGGEPIWNSIWLNLDRVLAILSMITLVHWEGVIAYWPYCLASLACMIISETIFRQEKWCYLVFHTIWHLSAFHLAYLFVLVDV